MGHLLIIDDNKDVRDLTALLLRSVGHTVDTVEGAREGLAAYAAGAHDLVITDIMMPDMDGLELIAHLRHAAPRPRVIAISGGTMGSMPVHLPAAKNLGVERILAKPIEARVLFDTVADVLARPGPPTIAQAKPA
jgi:CheY-like chemotaxis protein